ncbi:MAG: hypothetical protein ACKOEY_05020 [Phenylobacterium sp.]
MKKTLVAGLAGLSIALAGGAAFAAAGKSVDTTPIAELAADPAGKAVLDKELPGITQHPAYEQFQGMTLRQLQPMSGGMLTDEKLAAIQKDLDAAPASAPAQAPAPATK